ncbi:MAG: hypothetical protein J7L54_06430 [Elusimicrobia bacterium]|nr:hypothetical protein [Elusimicrobiota bacterium]
MDLTSKTEKIVTVSNDGNSQIEIHARPTCDCLEVFPEKVSVPPSQNRKFRIVFNPSGFRGKIRHSIYFETTDRKIPFVNYYVEADVSGVFSVFFFYDENCASCEEILGKLGALKRKYGFKIKKFPLSNPENFEYLMFIEKAVGVKSGKFPVLAAGEKIISGKDEILKRSERAILHFRPLPAAVKSFASEKIRTRIAKSFLKISLFPVAAAAFVDGINPCAFAGIIFMVSYMSFILKKSAGQILSFGAGYSAGVCVFYFLTGAGLFEALKVVFFLKTAGRIFYFFLALATAVLAVLSFRDAFFVKKGRGMSLRVPDAFMVKMKQSAARLLDRRGIFFYAFLIGGVVSSFEFVCTGQIYLPTISYIISVSPGKGQSYALLLFYSVIFTLPLIAVFGLIFAGRNSDEINGFFQKNVFVVKILNGLIFAAFSVFLLLRV